MLIVKQYEQEVDITHRFEFEPDPAIAPPMMPTYGAPLILPDTVIIVVAIMGGERVGLRVKVTGTRVLANGRMGATRHTAHLVASEWPDWLVELAATRGVVREDRDALI